MQPRIRQLDTSAGPNSCLILDWSKLLQYEKGREMGEHEIDELPSGPLYQYLIVARPYKVVDNPRHCAKLTTNTAALVESPG